MGFLLSKDTELIFEKEALPGVKRVLKCVSSDMEKVFGSAVKVSEGTIESAKKGAVIAITLGHTALGSLTDVSDIEGKREVYKYIIIDGKLLIIGSDKRGTIYGLFHLSELMGVSPFVDWFKLLPLKKESVTLEDKDIITSKEPSVRYRGFFINDEWPAFGNWCTKNFGGFNAKAYEQIFLLLLRLKGNYMWPAMWSAIFPNDGPGLLNCELADELGVVMGMSHHEPCLRQGEEYKYLRGPESIYGDAWNFRSNEEGITRFWEDGLKRSGKFENVITVGMRGEADTAIMGKNATLKDNIDLLRDVLKTQNRLIKENVNENLNEVPRMLALYKEVEPYFYGDETTEGLMDSPELEGVTLMLCDDNYGNLRTVPTEHMRSHKGGYGMYYHFDYHGFPVSFEWVNSSYLPKVWEQMTSAYEFGIRDLWIVNVGDLFSMEYPLAYFLDLAYDYEKWGITNLNSGSEYTKEFLLKNFGERCDTGVIKEMFDLLMGYTRIAHVRRPEAMNDKVYAPFMYGESDNLLTDIDYLETLCGKITESVHEDLKYPIYELITYPAIANLNVQKTWLYTTKNHAYARIGANRAELMADLAQEGLKMDEAIVNELHEADNGRWYGMGLSEHMGFKHWCEEECEYPVLHSFKRGNKPRIIVSVPGTEQHTEGGVWTRKTLILPDFLLPGVTEAYICLISAGAPDEYSVTSSVPYIEVANGDSEGRIEGTEEKLIKITYDISKYCSDEDAFLTVKTSTGDIKIEVPVLKESEEELAKKYKKGIYPWLGSAKKRESGFDPYQYVSMEAAGFSSLKSVEVSDTDAGFKVLPLYGRTISALKAFPVDKTFTEDNAPSVTYTFEVKRDGKYVSEIYMNPSNAPFMDGHLYYGVSVNDGPVLKADALPEGFKVGDNQPDWSLGVLENIRKAKTVHELKAGINTITFYALSPSFVLEKVVIYEEGNEPERSYLGPKETYRV